MATKAFASQTYTSRQYSRLLCHQPRKQEAVEQGTNSDLLATCLQSSTLLSSLRRPTRRTVLSTIKNMAALDVTTTPVTAFSQHSKRRMSTTKGSLDSAFRYEKSRPRARTMAASSKGHARGGGSVVGGKGTRNGISTDAGRRVHIKTVGGGASGSASHVPAGPKSAFSRISLERGVGHFQQQQQQAGAALVSRQSTSSEDSDNASSERGNTAVPVDLPNGLAQQHRRRIVDASCSTSPSVGTKPRSSTSSSTINGHSAAASTLLSTSTFSISTANNAVASSIATPRRIHIAPLRLVNSNGTAGSNSNTGGGGVPYTGNPLLSSSSTTGQTTATVSTAVPSSSSIWSYGTILSSASTIGHPPSSSSRPNSSQPSLYRFKKSSVSVPGHTSPSFVPIDPSSVHSPSSAPPSHQVQYAFQHQQHHNQHQQHHNQYQRGTHRSPPSMSYQASSESSVQVGTAPRRTSDFTVMQVIHPHYPYSVSGNGTIRNIAPLPQSSGGDMSMSPSFSHVQAQPFLQHHLTRSTPASWSHGPTGGFSISAGGRYYGYTSHSSPEEARQSAGWPHPSDASMYKTPHMANARLPTSASTSTSPAYRFPLPVSSAAPPTLASTIQAWHSPEAGNLGTGTGAGTGTGGVSLQYDSMRGSLKRKASLGLVDARALGGSTTRRRSSGEGSGGSGSRRGSSKAGADKLPPIMQSLDGITLGSAMDET